LRCALVDLQAVVARPSKSSVAAFAVGVEEIQEQEERRSRQAGEVACPGSFRQSTDSGRVYGEIGDLKGEQKAESEMAIPHG